MTDKWEDFEVSDEDRSYCAQNWALIYLADIFAPEVIKHYTDPEAKRVKNHHLALRRWMQRASPGGSMHNSKWWETCCQKAKSYKDVEQCDLVVKRPESSRERHRESNTGHPRSTWVANNKVGREALKHIRTFIK